MMRGVINLFKCVVSRICSWFRPAKKKLQVSKHNDFPDRFVYGVIYLVGEDGQYWFASLLCPCQCGDTIKLSLLGSAHPRWCVIEYDDATITVQPSVWRKQGCKSHFFIQHSEIIWCKSLEQHSMSKH